MHAIGSEPAAQARRRASPHCHPSPSPPRPGRPPRSASRSSLCATAALADGQAGGPARARVQDAGGAGNVSAKHVPHQPLSPCSAPARRPLGARSAPARRPLGARSAPARRPLGACSAPARWPLRAPGHEGPGACRA
jgi:hypothetical protein